MMNGILVIMIFVFEIFVADVLVMAGRRKNIADVGFGSTWCDTNLKQMSV